MNRAEKCNLLASLCAFESLLKEAISRAGEEQLFDNLSDPDCAFVYTALCEYYKGIGEMPSPMTLRSEVETRLWAMPGLPQHVSEASRELVKWIRVAIDEGGLNEKLGALYLTEAIAEGIRVSWSRGVSRLKSIDDMTRHVEKARRDLAMLKAPTEDARCDLFADPSRYLVKVSRRTTGIHPFDMILGGGLASGEVMGFVAPTGCGKTSFCVALASEWVLEFDNVMMFTYEQDAKGDVAERFYAYLLQKSVTEFRDKSYDELSEETRWRMECMRAGLEDRLTIVNMADPNLKLKLDPRDPASDMRDYIERNHKEGKAPALVILDWFGAKILQLNSFATRQYESPYQVFGQALIDGVRDLAKKYEFAAVITQQLSTEASKKSASVKPCNTDVLNFKTFFNYMDCGMLLGTQVKGKDRVGWAVAGKNRRGTTGDRMIVLKGEYGRFEDAAGDYVEDHLGRLVRKDAREYDGENTIK